MSTERDGVSYQEFIRTRDSVVTGLTKLNGAISTLIEAFVSHTNKLLSAEGQEGAVLDTKTLTEFLANAGLSREPIAEPKKEKKKRAKKEKDPNAPKRPLTAFFLFSSKARDHVKTDLGTTASPVDVNSEILRRWGAMDEAQKTKWRDLYGENYEQYKLDVAEYKKATGNDIAVEDANSDDDELPDIHAIDAGVGAEDSSSSDESESEEEEPPKPPTPPPKKAKGGKRKAKENGVVPMPAASPSPSAQLMHKETPIPVPGDKANKKRKDASPEEPKQKKARKSKAVEAEVAPPPSPEKKKKKSRKIDGF